MNTLPGPAEILPHRPPFLFVDELVKVEPGVSAVGLWHLTGDEWFFAGHFPSRPTLPGVLCSPISGSPASCRCSAVSTRRGSAGRLVQAIRWSCAFS
jgi:3-hydroxyacyl-[acyl-carrier-protein] dehydratase